MRHKELKIPEGTPPGQAFVQILDPATGTGTFLVEVIDLIHKTMAARGGRRRATARSEVEALWNDYVPKHLLPRLHGYELLMAPYAIAHLKIGLKLYETGYRFESDERAHGCTSRMRWSRLRNEQFMLDLLPALFERIEVVNRRRSTKIKRKWRFTVVIGNPPYSGLSFEQSGAVDRRPPEGAADYERDADAELLPRRRRATRRTKSVAPG